MAAARASLPEKPLDANQPYRNGAGTRNNAARPAPPPENTRFRFGTWFRLHIIDILTLAAMGAIGLGVYFARPAPSRSFPVYLPDGNVAWPQYAYPLRKEIIPIYAAALIAFFVPFLFITLFQARRRSADDWLTTTLGLLKSLVTAAVFQVFIKWLIGGLRPHFYAVCQPNVTAGSQTGNGFANLFYDRSICTGDQKQINDALESMPSGHATAAWAGLFYLSLYLNAQLKVMSAHNPAYWKMVLFFAPLLGATLISGALTIDAYHNWYDVVAGGIIGTACAIVAFRQTFASILDFRFNHILLPRATSLAHRRPFISTHGAPYYSYQPGQQFASHDLPFTREGGWGPGGGGQSTGAPWDASGFNAAGALGGSGAGTSGLGYGHTSHVPHPGREDGVMGRNHQVGNADTLSGNPPIGHHAV